MNFLLRRAGFVGASIGLALALGLHAPGGDATAAGLAIALGIIGAIYVGTLLSAPQTGRAVVQELLAAGFTLVFVALGVFVNLLWLVPGYIWHGAWDWMHHNNRFGARIVSWYPPFCAAIDFVIGVFILVWWWPY